MPSLVPFDRRLQLALACIALSLASCVSHEEYRRDGEIVDWYTNHGLIAAHLNAREIVTENCEHIAYGLIMDGRYIDYSTYRDSTIATRGRRPPMFSVVIPARSTLVAECLLENAHRVEPIGKPILERRGPGEGLLRLGFEESSFQFCEDPDTLRWWLTMDGGASAEAYRLSARPGEAQRDWERRIFLSDAASRLVLWVRADVSAYRVRGGAGHLEGYVGDLEIDSLKTIRLAPEEACSAEPAS